MINPLHYDHLPFIASAYALFFGAVLVFSFGTQTRLARVTLRLRAADPRARQKDPSS